MAAILGLDFDAVAAVAAEAAGDEVCQPPMTMTRRRW